MVHIHTEREETCWFLELYSDATLSTYLLAYMVVFLQCAFHAGHIPLDPSKKYHRPMGFLPVNRSSSDNLTPEIREDDV